MQDFSHLARYLSQVQRDLAPLQQAQREIAALGVQPAMVDFARNVQRAQRELATFAAQPAMVDFARNVQRAQRELATFAAQPAMVDFTDVMHAAERVIASDEWSEFAETTAVQAVAATEAAEAPWQDEFEVYDFSWIFTPAARKPIQASIAAVVFVATFSFVVEHFSFASIAGTLIGTSPLWAAQVAWTLTGALLKSLSDEE
ncbi:MAG: hypothetical protein ACT4RN_16245 [Pseudonocardia sp.]